jgi:transcriptional regulator with XRE-family HTH domain
LHARITRANHPLRAARLAKGLSLRDLAYFAGCAHTTIARLERDEINASAELKARLAHVLDVPVTQFWAPPSNDDGESRMSVRPIDLDALPPTLPVWSSDSDEPCAGRLLGVSRGTAFEAVRRGDIPSLRIAGRIRVPTAALRRLLDGQPARSPKDPA